MTIDSLTRFFIENESNLRLAIFLSVFTTFALLELIAPRRKLIAQKSRRWLNNIAIAVIDTVVLRLLFPAAAVGMAILVEKLQWGLFNLIELPGGIEIGLAILLLDLAIYAQHVMVHYVPLFWKFHRMHHADLDIDVTTGSRFHPVEIVFSMLIKFIIIALTGAHVIAVFMFEVILNSMAMFSHSNIKLPAWLDKSLRVIFVTPDMHRVHHSALTLETNSNFGFNLSIWDRLFSTYIRQPEKGHDGMMIGLENIRDNSRCISMAGMLKLPFQK